MRKIVTCLVLIMFCFGFSDVETKSNTCKSCCMAKKAISCKMKKTSEAKKFDEPEFHPLMLLNINVL